MKSTNNNWIIIGTSIIVVIATILLGINFPLIILDLILKVISFVSGTTFFRSMIGGNFNANDPLFIAYITIFLLTMILSIAYTIKYSIKKVYNKIDNDSGTDIFKRNNFFKRFKFIIFWFFGFFFVPIIVNLLLIGASSLASLFGIQILEGNLYDKFTQSEILIYLNEIKNSIAMHENKLIELKGILEIIKNHPDIENFITDKELEEINNQINNISSSLDKLGYFKDAILNVPLLGNNKFNDKIDEAIKAWNNFVEVSIDVDQNFIKDMIKKYNKETNDVILSLGDPDIIIGNFNESLMRIDDLIVKGQKVPTDDGYRFLNITLSHINILNTEKVVYKSERITMILSNLLYPGEPFLSPFEITSSISGLINNIPGLIWWFFDFFVSKYVTNYWGIFTSIIKTVSLTLVLGVFFDIAVNFGKRTFQLLGLIIVSPYFFISGVSDEGKKLTLWFETVISKILLILFVSLSIEIWSILVISLEAIPKMVDSIYGNTFLDIGYTILKLFITCILLVSSTFALLEFINYLSEMFKSQDMIRIKKTTYLNQSNQQINNNSIFSNKGMKQTNSFNRNMEKEFSKKSSSSNISNTSNKYSNVPIQKLNDKQSKKGK